MSQDMLPPEKVYCSFINQNHYSFWSEPSQEGLDIMRACKKALSEQFNLSDLFSGTFRLTYTLVGYKVDLLSRRITYWQSLLDKS